MLRFPIYSKVHETAFLGRRKKNTCPSGFSQIIRVITTNSRFVAGIYQDCAFAAFLGWTDMKLAAPRIDTDVNHIFFILLTHEGSHREVYQEFQPS